MVLGIIGILGAIAIPQYNKDDSVGGPVLWASLSDEEKAVKTACWNQPGAALHCEHTGKCWVVGENKAPDDWQEGIAA